MKKAPKPFGFKALSWRRKRDSNYVPPIFLVPPHNIQLSKNGFIIDISSPPRLMRDKASRHIGGKTGGDGGSNGVKNPSHPDTFSMKLSMRFALSCFIFSVTCPYTSSVNAAVACPRFVCTVFTSSPSEREVTANECRRS